MQTQIKRRYTPSNKAEYKIYSEWFDKYLMDSNIMNSENNDINAFMIFWDAPTMKATLYKLEGDAKGEFKRVDKVIVPALIPNTRKRFQLMKDKFEIYCNQKESLGYERPTEWPIELLTERLKIEARLDVYLREAEYIKAKLEAAQVVKKEIDDKKILHYGPQGSGRLRDGQLCELDGQEVQMVGGVLVITSEASPYYGMKVSDYRKHICEPWRIKRTNEVEDATKRRQEEIQEKGFSRIEIPSVTGPRHIDKSQLPPWPKGVKNYLIEKEAK